MTAPTTTRLGKFDRLAALMGARIIDLLEDFQDDIDDLVADRLSAADLLDEDKYLSMLDEIEEKLTLRACRAVVNRSLQNGDKVSAAVDRILVGEQP